MEAAKSIKKAIEGSAQAMRSDPAAGVYHLKVVSRLGPNLECASTDGKFTIQTDMAKPLGGSGSAPSPGLIARMALSSCLAVGYGMWMARLELPYESIAVELEADANQRGFLAVDSEVSPGFSNLQVRVNIVSAAPQDKIGEAVAQADRHSPVLHLVTQPVAVKRELHVAIPASPTPG